jgi:hypothetical protein
VEGIFPESQFKYEAKADQYVCPAGERLERRRYIKRRHVWEYSADKSVCAGCALRAQCTRSKTGRVLSRHEDAGILETCRQQSHSAAGQRDRQRRQHLLEGSFADAANNHGFKRARWRRLWRQQIQDYLIAAIQNIRILLSRTVLRPPASSTIDLNAWRVDVVRPGKHRIAHGDDVFGLLGLCRADALQFFRN